MTVGSLLANRRFGKNDSKAGFLVHNGLFLVFRAINLLSIESIVTAIWVAELKVGNTLFLSNSKTASAIFPLVLAACLMGTDGNSRDENIVALEKPRTAFWPSVLATGLMWRRTRSLQTRTY